MPMVKHYVTVHRTEEITFEVDAYNPDDAEERYLAEGDEIFSETVRTEVVSSEEVEGGRANISAFTRGSDG